VADIKKILNAIRQEKIDGWLFYNVEHRDTLSDLILEVPEESMNSRPWIYLVTAEGREVKVVHTIEPSILDSLPGEKRVYSSFGEYKREIESLLEYGGNRSTFALNYSDWNPFTSFIDHGFVVLLKKIGFKVTSSEGLVNRLLGTLDDKAIETHERAASLLYKIVFKTWDSIIDAFERGVPVTEGEVQYWIGDMFNENKLVSRELPLVATGKNTGNPHYFPEGEGAVLKKGDVVQLDIWAKLGKPGSVYADISWVGYLGNSVPHEVARVFMAVTSARDRAYSFIEENIESGNVTGKAVDAVTRKTIEQAGFGSYLRHRAGHSIGTEVHGYGVNLDSIEFPDRRKLLEGSCFSIEPGIYMEDFGVRSEIDVYIKGGRPVISGSTISGVKGGYKPQKEILTLNKDSWQSQRGKSNA